MSLQDVSTRGHEPGALERSRAAGVHDLRVGVQLEWSNDPRAHGGADDPDDGDRLQSEDSCEPGVSHHHASLNLLPYPRFTCFRNSNALHTLNNLC